MLLAQGQIYAKNMAFYVPVGFVRFARYCGKMYSSHLFPYSGLLSAAETELNLRQTFSLWPSNLANK